MVTKKIIGVLFLGFLLLFVIILDWSNITNYYSFPMIDGLRRLGSALFFPQAWNIEMQNPKSILFTHADMSLPGFALYRFGSWDIWPKELFPKDYRIRDFKISPDKKHIAFVGWGRDENQVWISAFDGTPKPVEDRWYYSLEPIYLAWAEDGSLLYIFYFEPHGDYRIGTLDPIKREYTDLYDMIGGDAPIDGIDVLENKIVYVAKNNKGAITIYNTIEKKVTVLDLGNYWYQNVRFLKNRPWLIGLQNNQIAFIDLENKCVVSPFPNLTEIRTLSYYETSDNVLISMTDDRAKLYLLDLKEALKLQNISTLFHCEK